MKIIEGQFYSTVKLTPDEAKEICKKGQKENCCAFLAFQKSNFVCLRMSEESDAIFTRLDSGTIKTKGEGCWSGCPWEKK
jgi:hypothetical protein